MAIIPTPYSQFLAQDSILSTAGGPWHCSGFGGQRCVGSSTSWTNNQTSIYSYLQGNDTAGDYSMSLQAAVLVDLTSFGGSDELVYSWSFLATAFSDHPSGRSSMLISSRVGEATYTDYAPWLDVTNNQTWTNASYFLHTGTVTPSGNGPLRVIELSLEITLNHLPSETIGPYLRHLQLGLGAATITPTTTPSTTDSTASTTEETSPTTIPESPTSNNTLGPIGASNTPKTSSNAWIIGGSVGGVALILLLALLALFLLKRRRRMRRVSISKVRNVKRVSPLLSDNPHMGVIDIARPETGFITPFYSGPVRHDTRRSRASATTLSYYATELQRSPPVPPPPSYLESPSSPPAEQATTSPTSLIRQHPYSHHRISIF